MLFNSLEFAIFLPLVFILYWFVFDYALKNCKRQLFWQNLFIVAASYVFYGWWDWRFLFLITFTSFCSWLSGVLMALYQSRAKLITCINIVINLAILGLFKYYDFFVGEFAHLFGLQSDRLLLNIILPVGVSFYTFQALSYSIDVYRKKIEPTRDIVAFFAYVSFFPQLVAGPIERATNLLPQFQKKRQFDYTQAVDGMRQILWGLFKKIVVADNCATYVDQVFSTYQTQTGSTLLLAAVLFTFQIYGDFSGYSDIAIGTSKLFGIKLMRNFNNPYFSRDIAEFWRRWHISLTTWFRDYIYIPLGGSRPLIPEHIKHPDRYKKWVIIWNTFIIFLVSGLWHGANWTFICWGLYHALLFLPLILLGKNRKYLDTPTWRDIPKMLLTFAFVVIGWIIFRVEHISDLLPYLQGMCQWGTFRASYRFFLLKEIRRASCAIIIMLFVEWINRKKAFGLSMNNIKFTWCKILIYYTIIFIIWQYGTVEQTFIYFQF